MNNIFLKKFKNTFLTPHYSSKILAKFYNNNSVLLKILSKFFWFIPNNNQYNYWLNSEDFDHGHRKFIDMDNYSNKILETILNNSSPNDKVLDICCNAGRVLSALSLKGYKNLYGFDINFIAIQESKNVFNNLKYSNLKIDTAENYLNKVKKNEFEVTYSLGASLELIPSHFPLIFHIARITKKFHICLINENGHAYPRFWKYEFKKHFSLVEFYSYGKDRTLFILKK